MMTQERRAELEAEVTAERVAQGLPPKITDPVFLASVVRAVRGTLAAGEREKQAS